PVGERARRAGRGRSVARGSAGAPALHGGHLPADPARARAAERVVRGGLDPADRAAHGALARGRRDQGVVRALGRAPLSGVASPRTGPRAGPAPRAPVAPLAPARAAPPARAVRALRPGAAALDPSRGAALGPRLGGSRR